MLIESLDLAAAPSEFESDSEVDAYQVSMPVRLKRCDIPSAVSLDRLKKGFPLDWAEQRKFLGFTA